MNALTDTQICNTVLIVDDEPGQLEYLKSLGCEAIQGYLFGKAEGSERTKEILARIERGEPIRNLAA